MCRNTAGRNQTFSEYCRSMRHRFVAIRAIALVALITITSSGPLRGQTIEHLIEICDAEQQRLDLLDGKKDTAIAFSTQAQFVRGRHIYFDLIDRIQAN